MNKLMIGTLATLIPFGAAHAATVSDTAAFGPAVTEITSPGSSNPLGSPITAPTLELALFDGSLGTLNSVTVTLTGSFNSDGVVVNSSSGPVIANAAEEVTFLFESSLFALTPISASDSTGFISFSQSPKPTAVSFSDSMTETLTPGGLASFVGSAGDTFEIDYATLVTTSFQGGGGNLDFFVDTVGSVAATVVYDFTENPMAPIPLPASLPLLLVGLAGFGLVARRRRG